MGLINTQTQALAAKLMTVNGRPEMLMPYYDEKSGSGFYIVNNDGIISTIPMDSIPAMYQQNAVVPLDAYKALETTFTKVKRERLVMHSDAMSVGTVPVGDMDRALGTFQYDYPKLDDPGQAKIGMELRTNTTNKTHDISYDGIPMPIIWDEFSLTGRQLKSLNRGQYGLGGLTIQLDQSLIEGCTRRVAESMEDMMVDGASMFTFNGKTIYGYTNFPSRNTYTLPLSWTNASITGQLMLTDVLNMIKENEAVNYNGPYTLYIPKAYNTALEEDFKDNSDKTIRQRLLEIPQISQIKVVDRLTADTLILVQLASDVVQIVDGFGPSVIQWDSPDGLTFNYYVMAMQIPLFRSTYSGQCGFCHATVS